MAILNTLDTAAPIETVNRNGTTPSNIKKVTYDGRSLIINGKRELLLCGEVHYAHSTPAMWREIIARSKEMGLNTIQSYVFWNLHERERGNFDLSGRLDLPKFLDIIQEFGMYAVMRVGPYACAETNYGGYPPWLRDIPGVKLRTYNEPYMKEMDRYLNKIHEVIKPYLLNNGGPIVMAEIENEYHVTNAEDQKYCDWFIGKAKEWNLQIPLMCNHETDGAINTIHASYAADHVDKVRKERPGFPVLWTEFWPGWHLTWGYPAFTRHPEEITYQMAKFYGKGGAGTSLYMWHAGTHFARESMYLQPPEYGFTAALDEYGLPTTVGLHTSRLLRLINQNAALMLEGELPAEEQIAEGVAARTFSNGTDSLSFIWNDSDQATSKVTFEGKKLSLKPKSVIVLKNGKPEFNSAEVRSEDRANRKMVAKRTVKLDGNLSEPLPSERTSLPLVENKEPVEQLKLTNDRTDYCWYSNRISLKKNDNNGLGYLNISRGGDLFYVYVDGKLIGSSPLPLLENRGPTDSPAFSQDIRLLLQSGEHEISILACALGLIKHQLQIGLIGMETEKKGIWGPVYWKGKKIEMTPWKMQPFLSLENTDSYKNDLKKNVRWEKPSREKLQSPLTWYNLSFKMPTTKGDAYALDMNSMNKGMIWLNGQCLSRYWLIKADSVDFQVEQKRGHIKGQGEPTQRYYHIPKDWLRKDNELVIFEEVGGDPRDIKICEWVSKK